MEQILPGQASITTQIESDPSFACWYEVSTGPRARQSATGSTYSNGLGADVRPAAPAAGAKRFSPGNPMEGVPNGLATRVSTPCRVRSSLRWARDRGANVSTRGLTLPLVTL